MTDPQLVTELRRALREMLSLMEKGSTFPKLARAQGYVDGYMRAILDAKLLSQRELLALVSEERSNQSGPPTATAEGEDGFALSRAVA